MKKYKVLTPGATIEISAPRVAVVNGVLQFDSLTGAGLIAAFPEGHWLSVSEVVPEPLSVEVSRSCVPAHDLIRSRFVVDRVDTCEREDGVARSVVLVPTPGEPGEGTAWFELNGVAERLLEILKPGRRFCIDLVSIDDDARVDAA